MASRSFVGASHEETVRAAVAKTYGKAAVRAERANSLSRDHIVERGSVAGTACADVRGLGCGNPTTLADLKPGETVLDLGSGPGFDCLVATLYVGKGGLVVGIDVTAEMVRLARNHASDAGVLNVAFVQGEIERLPFPDQFFDVVLSNCVINLCPDKVRIFSEMNRVLRRGGRFAVSDMVAVRPLPANITEDLALYSGCLAGVVTVDELYTGLRLADFRSARIAVREDSRQLIHAWAPGRGLEDYVRAADVVGIKT